MPVIHNIHGFAETNAVFPQDTGFVPLQAFASTGGFGQPWVGPGNAI